MKVSVVVPLYNKAKWVRRSLDSLAAQSFKDFEVIVVDDGSTDGSGEIVATYPDPRVRLVCQPNAGPGAARNRGIAEARGEFLAFLDADDEWMPEFLEQNLAALEAAGPEVAAVVCGYVEFPAVISRERMWRRRGVEEGLFRATPQTVPQQLVYLLAYMNPWATMIRTATLQRHGGFFGRERCLYGEDAYLWLKVLLNEQVLVTMTPLVRFHTEASSLSKNLKGARPVEPFLKYPEELEAACPRELKPLLREVLSIRASKTACVLAYWGKLREASEILDRFRASRRLAQPWAVTAALCVNPLGAMAGRILRGVFGTIAAALPEPPPTPEPGHAHPVSPASGTSMGGAVVAKPVVSSLMSAAENRV